MFTKCSQIHNLQQKIRACKYFKNRMKINDSELLLYYLFKKCCFISVFIVLKKYPLVVAIGMVDDFAHGFELAVAFSDYEQKIVISYFFEQSDSKNV